MLAQPLVFCSLHHHLHRRKASQTEGGGEESEPGRRVDIKCDECLSTEKAAWNVLDFNQNYLFLGAARLLSHALMSTDILTLITP